MNAEHLLGRHEFQFDEARWREVIAGRRILVTGSGGSIGSEICRQIARLEPASLILFDQSEFNLFTVANALADLAVRKSVIGTVRDLDEFAALCGREKPDYIIHTAALKHVGLCQTNVREAFLTNYIGTRNVVDCAAAIGVPVVLISTDKAVQPVSIMGATKRAAEAASSGEIIVRLCNVLGSSGSMGQIFDAQIAAGGPVTITDSRMTRYFITPYEAAGMVLDAIVADAQGVICVPRLDVPTSISELAWKMIDGKSVSGIRYIGAQPGEKLSEVLSSPREVPLRKTPTLRILAASPERAEIFYRAQEATADDPKLADHLLTLVRTE